MKSNNPTLLLIGASGFIGSQFVDTSNHFLLKPSKSKLDITNAKMVWSYFKNNHFNVVVNFAAFTDLDKAEEQRGDFDASAWKVNVIGVKNIAQVCKKQNIFLIHISTDAVFAGNKTDPGPYSETHLTSSSEQQLSWYGWTKRHGEEMLKSFTDNYALLRISWPVGLKDNFDKDYIQKLLIRIKQHTLPPLFDDQYFTITYIPDLIKVLHKLISKKKRGIYHVSSRDRCTPYQLAKYLLKRLSINYPLAKTSITKYKKTAQFPNRYHQFSGLSTENTVMSLKTNFPSWKEIADDVTAKIFSNEELSI